MERIGNSIPRILKELGLEKEAMVEELRKKWPKILGKRLAKGTEVLRLREKTLIVGVEDAARRAFLASHRADVLEKLREFGFKGIKEIKFVKERMRK